MRQQETVGGGRPLTPNRISGSAYKTRQYRFMHEAASGSDQESVTSDDESSDEDTDDIDDARFVDDSRRRTLHSVGPI